MTGPPVTQNVKDCVIKYGNPEGEVYSLSHLKQEIGSENGLPLPLALGNGGMQEAYFALRRQGLPQAIQL